MEREIDLGEIADLIIEQFTSVSALYLFGSRVYNTGSIRSDIDILVRTTEYIQPAKLRSFINEYCSALDLFIIDGKKAVSVQNESFVEGISFENLVSSLNAEKFWDKERGRLEIKASWKQLVRTDIEYLPTCLPNAIYSNEETVDVGKLTLYEIIKSLTTSQTKAIISTIIMVLIGVFSLGLWVGTTFSSKNENVLRNESSHKNTVRKDNSISLKEYQKLNIIRAEISGSEFDRKRVEKSIAVLLDESKRTEAFNLMQECTNLVNYKEPYFFEKKNYKENIAVNAIRICSKAVEKNKDDLFMSFLLSVAYLKNHDYNDFISKLTETAELGDKTSQRKLGILYLTGNFVKKDINIAQKWLFEAAENGDNPAKEIIDEKYYEVR